jgi:hypothetical protein
LRRRDGTFAGTTRPLEPPLLLAQSPMHA